LEAAGGEKPEIGPEGCHPEKASTKRSILEAKIIELFSRGPNLKHKRRLQ
jgi:hypothetical protein